MFFWCVFLSFPGILGVPQREIPLLLGGVPCFLLPQRKKQGLEGQGSKETLRFIASDCDLILRIPSEIRALSAEFPSTPSKEKPCNCSMRFWCAQPYCFVSGDLKSFSRALCPGKYRLSLEFWSLHTVAVEFRDAETILHVLFCFFSPLHPVDRCRTRFAIGT